MVFRETETLSLVGRRARHAACPCSLEEGMVRGPELNPRRGVKPPLIAGLDWPARDHNSSPSDMPSSYGETLDALRGWRSWQAACLEFWIC